MLATLCGRAGSGIPGEAQGVAGVLRAGGEKHGDQLPQGAEVAVTEALPLLDGPVVVAPVEQIAPVQLDRSP